MTASSSTELSDIKSQFLNDFSRYAISSIVPGVVGVLLVVVLTHLFPASIYGQYALTMACVAILSTVATGWVGQAILRFEPELDERTLLATSSLALSVSVFAVISGGVIGYYALSDLLGGYRLFFLGGVLLIAAQSVYSVVLKLLQAGLQSGHAARLKVDRSLLRFLFGITIAVFVARDIAGWFVGAAIGTVVAVLCVLRRSRLPLQRPRYEPEALERMITFGVPMIGWLFGFTLLTFIDRTLLELLAGTTAVGVYSANYSIANRSLPLALGPVIQAAHPIVMNTWEGDNRIEVRSAITETTRYFLIVGVPATVYVVLFARPLSSLLVAPDYQGGYLVIPLVGVGVFVWHLAMIVHKGLEVMEQTPVMLSGVALAVGVNVVLNVALISSYGYLGAAGATLVSFLVYLLFAYALSTRYIHWKPPIPTLRNVLVASGIQTLLILVSYAVAGVTPGTALLAVGPSGLLYLICLYTLGEFRHDERQFVQNVIQP